MNTISLLIKYYIVHIVTIIYIQQGNSYTFKSTIIVTPAITFSPPSMSGHEQQSIAAPTEEDSFSRLVALRSSLMGNEESPARERISSAIFCCGERDCRSVGTNPIIEQQQEPWYVTLQCPSHRCQCRHWIICRCCGTKLTQKGQHNRNKTHNDAVPLFTHNSPFDLESDEADGCNQMDISQHDITMEECNNYDDDANNDDPDADELPAPTRVLHKILDFNDHEHMSALGSTKDKEFYKAHITEGDGLQVIVRQSLGMHNCSLSELDVKIFAKLTHICSLVTHEICNEIGEVFELLYEKIEADKKDVDSETDDISGDDKPPLLKTNIPGSSAEFRKVFWDTDPSSRSLINQIPSPSYLPLGSSKSAVADMKDVVTQALALGYPVELMDQDTMSKASPDSIFNTKRAHEIWDEIPEDIKSQGVKVVLLQIWSDGFEPNSAKDNRGSAHVESIFLVPPDGESGNDNSFAIAFAAGSDKDHEEVHAAVSKAFNELSANVHYCYNKRTGRIEPFIVKLFNRLADWPERAQITGTGNHNGTLTGVSGQRANLSCEAAKCLPSCADCIEGRLRNVPRDTSCECFDWNIEDKRMIYPLPEEYPTNHLPIEDEGDTIYAIPSPSPNEPPIRFMSGRKLSFEYLIAMVKLARQNLIQRLWKKKETTCFLKNLALNTAQVQSASDEKTLSIRLQPLGSCYFVVWVSMLSHRCTLYSSEL
jgi:hypothetical protein